MSVRRRLIILLGVLVGYLLANGLPADPGTAARDLAHAATSVERVAPARFRLDLEEDALDGVAGGATIEVEVREGRVAEMAVSPRGGEGGWRVVYGSHVPVEVDAPIDALSLPVPTARTRTMSAECEVSL